MHGFVLQIAEKSQNVAVKTNAPTLAAIAIIDDTSYASSRSNDFCSNQNTSCANEPAAMIQIDTIQ